MAAGAHILGEYTLRAVFDGLVWIEGLQRNKGTTMVYVVADQWRLPKETFQKFCNKKKFWPAWAIEVARTKGERIIETPMEYILTVQQYCPPNTRATGWEGERLDAECAPERRRVKPLPTT